MKILVAGDFCPNDRVQEAFDKKDYSALEAMKPIIAKADYSIVNFECPVVVGNTAKPINKCGPCLRTTPNAVEAVQYAGFNCATLANNHFRDFGDEGCITTMEHLKKAQIDFVGGGHNISEAQQILYKQLGDKKVAFVNFCENEFSIATDSQAGSAPLDTVDNYNQITEARRNADYVVVIVHGGHEHYQLPSPRMKKLYRFFVEIGADAVVNHHQHCYSGYEYYNGKPIVYGLGNFCFDWEGARNMKWNDGYMLMLYFGESISHIELIPYVQCNDSASVEILSKDLFENFNRTIDKLNAVIANDILLIKAFGDWIEKEKRHVILSFSSWHNKYLNAAASRGWIPDLTTNKEYGAILNQICCESHRDVSIAVLSEKLSQKEC